MPFFARIRDLGRPLVVLAPRAVLWGRACSTSEARFRWLLAEPPKPAFNDMEAVPSLEALFGLQRRPHRCRILTAPWGGPFPPWSRPRCGARSWTALRALIHHGLYSGASPPHRPKPMEGPHGPPIGETYCRGLRPLPTTGVPSSALTGGVERPLSYKTTASPRGCSRSCMQYSVYIWWVESTKVQGSDSVKDNTWMERCGTAASHGPWLKDKKHTQKHPFLRQKMLVQTQWKKCASAWWTGR